MKNESKVLNTLVNVQNEEEATLRVEAYCGKKYASGTVSCGSSYSDGSVTSVSEDLDILI